MGAIHTFQAGRLVQNQVGFSLLELMIVVALISILTTIAMPNYQRHVAKARQSEALTNLSSLYTAEKAFYAEWNAYTGDFRDIGLQMSGFLKYDVGFSSAGYVVPPPFAPSSSPDCEAGTAYNTEVSACALTPGAMQASALYEPAAASGPCGAGIDPTPTQFRATAVGLISSSSKRIPDVWTIDDSRLLCHNQDGAF